MPPLNKMPHEPARAVFRTSNKKLGDVSLTYAAQQSCPQDCAFLNNGCYAEHGTMRFGTTRCNSAAAELTPKDIAICEAAGIDALPRKYPLRLHVVGDCSTSEAAEIVSAAAERYTKDSRKPVWTYTHAWRTVTRESWGNVNVLASCEHPSDVLDAQERGYACALVVAEHETHKKHQVAEGVTGIPCPSQTRQVTCDECKLCWDEPRLKKEGLTILFEAHGCRKNHVVKRLKRYGLE